MLWDQNIFLNIKLNRLLQMFLTYRQGLRVILVFIFCQVMTVTAFAESVTLNLKGADINAVIGTVAEITGKNFIIDPRVKGKVTVISSRPMDEKEVYQVFPLCQPAKW